MQWTIVLTTFHEEFMLGRAHLATCFRCDGIQTAACFRSPIWRDLVRLERRGHEAGAAGARAPPHRPPVE